VYRRHTGESGEEIEEAISIEREVSDSDFELPYPLATSVIPPDVTPPSPPDSP
jgi:hypothetical protein